MPKRFHVVHDVGLTYQGERLSLGSADRHGFRLEDSTVDEMSVLFKLSERAVRRLRSKQCSECGQRFLADWTVPTCSNECAEKRHFEQVRTANLKRTESRRRRLQAKCMLCGVALTAIRSTKIYCSPSCRQRGLRKWGRYSP